MRSMTSSSSMSETMRISRVVKLQGDFRQWEHLMRVGDQSLISKIR